MVLAWLKNLWKKPITPIFPEQEPPVQYTYVDGDEQQSIRVLSGEFAGVVFDYGRVQFYEENDSIKVHFDYNLIENPNDADVKPHRVKGIFGDIIMDVLEREMKTGGLEHDRNSGKNDSSESDVQR